MKVGVLTAALQELTPREVRDPDPDRAIEDWLEFAQRARRRLHPAVGGAASDARPTCRPRRCSIRWPTRSTCASRSTRTRAQRVRRGARRDRRRHLRHRLLRQHAAPRPGDPRRRSTTSCCACSTPRRCSASNAVCGFVGRNQQRSMDQNLVDFEEQFVPLLKEAKARGLTYRVEQCPMPGWTTGDNWHNNIAYTPGHVDRAAPDLREARRRRSVPHPLRPVARDPDGAGHALDLPVPEGRRLQLPDRRLPRQGPGDRRRRASSAWGYGGQTVERGDWIDGKPSPNPADQLNAWKKQVVLAEHELPGTARHDPLAYLQNRTRRLARSPARRARAAAARRRQHAPGRRARVSEGAHPGPGARSSRSCRARSPSSATSTRRRRACTRCSTRCWRRRAFRCRASAGRRIGRNVAFARDVAYECELSVR